jgi:hypothetical protein
MEIHSEAKTMILKSGLPDDMKLDCWEMYLEDYAEYSEATAIEKLSSSISDYLEN